MTLRNKGLITQTRDDVDRRRQLIKITAEGQKIIDDRTSQSIQIVDNIKTKLGTDNYETLLDLLGLLDLNSND